MKIKISQICAFALFLIVASTLTFADEIKDPKVIIKGAGGSNANGKCEQCVPVGFNFSFTIPASGSGSLFFTNDSGKAWSSLKLIETGVPAADVSCHSSPSWYRGGTPASGYPGRPGGGGDAPVSVMAVSSELVSGPGTCHS